MFFYCQVFFTHFYTDVYQNGVIEKFGRVDRGDLWIDAREFPVGPGWSECGIRIKRNVFSIIRISSTHGAFLPHPPSVSRLPRFIHTTSASG